MQRKRVRPLTRIGWVATLTLTLAPAPARAWLDGARTILAEAAARRARLGFDTVVVDGYRRAANGALVPVWMAVAANRAVRLEVRHPDGTEVVLDRGRERHAFTRGGPVPPPQKLEANPFLELLGSTAEDPGAQRSFALLARMGIDTSIVSLVRFDGRPTYVIGAGPSDLSRPQLWLDKETLVPLRWLMESGGVLEDTRLLGYHMPTAGPYFPERIERWRGKNLESSTVFTSPRLNAPVDERLFAPPAAAR